MAGDLLVRRYLGFSARATSEDCGDSAHTGRGNHPIAVFPEGVGDFGGADSALFDQRGLPHNRSRALHPRADPPRFLRVEGHGRAAVPRRGEADHGLSFRRTDRATKTPGFEHATGPFAWQRPS
jgi:hypothetical protein